MTENELEQFMRQVSDLEYFEGKLERAAKVEQAASRIKSQTDLLEDAIIIYQLAHRPQPEELELLKFGFSKRYIISLLADKYGHTHQIPKSLLVQINMRELLDGMDRRRP